MSEICRCSNPDLAHSGQTTNPPYCRKCGAWWVVEYGSVVPGTRAAEKRHLGEQRTRVKVGRNEPCPCGSGKKYKKCCGGN